MCEIKWYESNEKLKYLLILAEIYFYGILFDLTIIIPVFKRVFKIE